jgi:uncharacterized protein
MHRKLLTILLLFVTIFTTFAVEETYTVDNVPNVQKSNRQEFVSDPAAYLTAVQRQTLNARLLALRDSTTAEMAVVVLPSIGDAEIFDFAQDLATKWGIGKKDKDNGLLLLLVMEIKKVNIHTGYGMEGVMTDAVCSRIISDDIIPYMKEDNLYGALNASTLHIYRLLSDPTALEEIKSDIEEEDALDEEVLMNFLLIICGLFFIASAVMYILAWRRARAAKAQGNYARALAWRKELVWQFCLGLLSAGTGLIFWLLALLHYRRRRTRRIKCDTCGTKMNRLSEEEDNKYLSSAENCEEELHTVDYDVWLCPKCGTIEKFPFADYQKTYTECPACHAVAYALKYEKILRPATTRSAGLGERVYECRHCGHRGSTRFNIPKKEDGVGLAIAGAAIGSSLGGRSGGGGISGGSFGGGSFGGGGASGSW